MYNNRDGLSVLDNPNKQNLTNKRKKYVHKRQTNPSVYRYWQLLVDVKCEQKKTNKKQKKKKKQFLLSACLYESTETYCCHFDVSMGIGITL